MDREPGTPQPSAEQPRPRRSLPGFKAPMVTGLLLAYIYLSWVIHYFSVVPTQDPQPSFQNTNATYYNVLNVSVNASGDEIFQGYDHQLIRLKNATPDASRKAHALNFTSLATKEEAKRAFTVLNGNQSVLVQF
ncbi:hypothetical protein F5B22DRAFT_660210 [Xylaria bambusicola]|uniref:uncharacterized protein n=1 Tax=Xylaria bambusicola TaxID=326684 RepID=UPI00200752C5|nr:uncharacterized protein F5B22DRAFT_660210 [Xylaria bambusicola]KAI0506437.1 hypothetical protein F5B22DRAFT_660210 [Xylaria bambusicola]